MAKITLVRHGVTEWNKEGRAQGQTDVPLSGEGMEQAKRVAERLSQEQWDAIYSSTLSRARQTAELIAAKLGGKEIVYDSRLKEIGGGLIEGTTLPERVEKWGPDWEKLDLKRETPISVAARGTEFLEEVEERHPGQNVLVIGHGAWMRHSLDALIPELCAHGPRKNTSVTKIRKAGGAWVCDLYNCTKHLDEAEGMTINEV